MSELPPIENSPPRLSQRPRWSAKAASFICPGFGQMLEQRFVAGIVQLSIFLCSFGFVVIVFARWMLSVINALSSDDSNNPISQELPQSVPWQYLLVGFVVSSSVYIWSIWDAGRGKPRPKGETDVRVRTSTLEDRGKA